VRRVLLAGFVLAAAFWLSGCFGRGGLRCENQERYVGSEERPPVRIPDDLDPPDQSRALTIPAERDGAGEGEGAAREERCLEAPPEYLRQGAPG